MIRIIFTLLFVLTLSACERQALPDPVDQSVRPAKLFQVSASRDDILHTFVARVEAAQTIDVSFQVPGAIASLPVLEGQSITKGAIIATLAPTDYNLALREASVQLDITRQDYERKLSLGKEKGISQAAVDDARALFELTEVKLAQAQENLDDTKITAPFAAYVSKRFVDNHVNVVPGQPIVRLHDLNTLRIVTNIPEHLLATVTTDRVKSITASFAFIPGEKFTLTPRENSGEAGSVAQTYEVSLEMARPVGWNILPGMTAMVEVVLSGTQTTVVHYIPVESVVGGADGSLYVWIYHPDTTGVEKRPVTVAPVNQKGLPVLTGLADGDIIVTAGASQLSPSMKVRPLGEIQQR